MTSGLPVDCRVDSNNENKKDKKGAITVALKIKKQRPAKLFVNVITLLLRLQHENTFQLG